MRTTPRPSDHREKRGPDKDHRDPDSLSLPLPAPFHTEPEICTEALVLPPNQESLVPDCALQAQPKTHTAPRKRTVGTPRADTWLGRRSWVWGLLAHAMKVTPSQSSHATGKEGAAPCLRFNAHPRGQLVQERLCQPSSSWASGASGSEPDRPQGTTTLEYSILGPKICSRPCKMALTRLQGPMVSIAGRGHCPDIGGSRPRGQPRSRLGSW